MKGSASFTGEIRASTRSLWLVNMTMPGNTYSRADAMFDGKHYGCEVAIVCYYLADNLYGTYSGFAVLRVDSGEEIVRFYEGDPVDDYDAALSYAQSITRYIERSP